MRRFAYPETVATRAPVETRSTAPMTKTIPFDYLFTFDLKGIPHNKVQDVVEISMQGVFVAVAIGYSLVPAERVDRGFPPLIDQTTTQAPLFAPLFEDDSKFLNGLVITGMPGAEITILDINTETSTLIGRTEVVPGPPRPDGSVLVKFVDAVTPTVTDTIAIGPTGSVTVIFESRIASGGFLRVWDRTNNLLSELVAHVSPAGGPLSSAPDDVNGPFFGLTPVIGPSSTTKKIPAAGETVVDVYGMPDDDVNLLIFNNAAGAFQVVDGGPFNLGSDTLVFPSRRTGHKSIPVTIRSVNQRLTAGDVLLVKSVNTGTVLTFSMFTIPSPRLSTITLGALAAGAETNGADLTCGVRLNPNVAGLLTADLPLAGLSPGTFDRLFESCCTHADEISFLYSIDILSTGRELQNEPIHNVAGLGIANGDRPFRPLARPIAFEPRSFIRIQIEELSRVEGTLYIVLQGYKTLGTGRIPE